MRYPGVKSVKTVKTNKALTLNWDNTNKINFTDGGLLGAYSTLAALAIQMKTDGYSDEQIDALLNRIK